MFTGLTQQLNNFGLPQEAVVRALFYLIAGLTVLFALCIVTSRNIFHSAIYLALALIGVAGVYLFLDAEFLAVAQVLIYVGAVVTLFLFAIMLTANIQGRAVRQTNGQILFSVISVVAFLFLFVKIIKKSHWQAASLAAQGPGIEQLGRSLMTTYLLPFEIISVILIAVLVGAIVIGRSEKK